MNTGRKPPAGERLIRNSAGLYFKDATWTLDKSKATVFRTLGDALRARRKFGLENVKVVAVASAEREWVELN